MVYPLKPHPDSRCDATIRIEVDALRPQPGTLTLRYIVTGEVSGLKLPSAAASERTDELWRHSCFEAFVRAPSGDSYYEFNFAPSTQWAAYRFESYRTGMEPARAITAPRIETEVGDGRHEMRVSLMVDALADLPSDTPWRIGLSAVIEDTDNRLSYWALAHPPGKADFHHSDCFAVELPAAWAS